MLIIGFHKIIHVQLADYRLNDIIGTINILYLSIMVWFFVPNLIGYVRVILLFPVLLNPENPWLLLICYSFSQLLDMIDGYAARALNQTSIFGTVLDMVTDRISNAILLAINGALYPSLRWIFYGDIMLDICSHWYQMYSTMKCG